MSSIVSDMLQHNVSSGERHEGFSAIGDLRIVVENFVMARECFFYHPHRAPYVQATFEAISHGPEHLDIGIHYSWNPPRVEFRGLQNVISEGDLLLLRPTVANLRPPQGPFQRTIAYYPLEIEFYTGSDDGWLEWNPIQEAFQGIVGRGMAEDFGAGRLATYTIQLDFTALVIQHFRHNVRLERIIRCAVPLTIKRRPDTCSRDAFSPLSHGARPRFRANRPDRETRRYSQDDSALPDNRRIRGWRSRSPVNSPRISRTLPRHRGAVREDLSCASNSVIRHGLGKASFLEQLFRSAAD